MKRKKRKKHGKGRKASKRTVRCTMCTPFKWMGNSKERFNHGTARRKSIGT